MERRLALVGLLVTLIALIFAVIAADYDILNKNSSNVVKTIETFLHINPAVLATIFTVPTTITLMWASRFWMKSSGVQIFSSRDNPFYRKCFERELEKCTSIDVVGIGNSQFTAMGIRKLLVYAVGVRRVSLRVLFLEPDGECIKMRQKEEAYKRMWLAQQVLRQSNALEKLRGDIEKIFPHSAQLIQYAYYDMYPVSNTIFFDGKAMFKQVYFFSIKGSENPIFFVENQHSEEIVRPLHAEFEKMWAGATKRDTP